MPRVLGRLGRHLLECFGLWYSTIASAFSASSALEPTASPPIAAASACALPASMSATRALADPLARAEAMLPAPMNPSFIRRRRVLQPEAQRPARHHGGPGAVIPGTGASKAKPFSISRARSSAETSTLRGVSRKHLVRDPLHPAVERVGEAGGEVDQALREVGVRSPGG